MTLTVGSLFSGIGGLDLGLERAGMTVRWQSEIDPYCCRVLERHWPGIPNLGDVTAVDWSTVEPVDLICGGYPCQPFSLAGRRGGAADARHLWPYFRDAIREVRPRYAVLENVPGHLSLGFADVLADLAALGFDAEWSIVSAADVGAPHLRRRLFVVAYPNGEGQPGQPVDAVTGPRQLVPSAYPERYELREQPVAVTESGSPAEPRDNGANGDVAYANDTGRIEQRGAIAGTAQCARSERGRWWRTEPDVGRVVARLSPGLDGGLNAHPECGAQASAAGIPDTHRLRALRRHLASPAASSEPERCAYCGHPLPAVPCRGACSPWRLGQGATQAEGLRCVREGVLGLLAQQGEDVQPYLSGGGWASERPQALGSRTDRLRALGNAVVPQVAELVGRRVMEMASCS